MSTDNNIHGVSRMSTTAYGSIPRFTRHDCHAGGILLWGTGVLLGEGSLHVSKQQIIYYSIALLDGFLPFDVTGLPSAAAIR